MGTADSVEKKDETQKKKEEKAKTLENAGLARASTEVVQRYGDANSQHFGAHEALKNISERKVNPDYEYQNLKQQAGYSAEIKETARENADRIIAGDETRVVRTDDIGRVNDPLYDHVEIDSKGNIIDGSGSQMKFVGKTPEAALDKLASKKFEKYLDADAEIKVPSDHYDGIKAETKAKIESLEEQVKHAKAQGNDDLAKQRQAELEKYKKIDKNLRKSKVSNEDAMEARKSPTMSTAGDIVKVSHEAGLEQAKMGAAIGGGLSIVKNLVAVAKGDKDAETAVVDVAKDTASAAGKSYVIAAGGSALKGAMQNSGEKVIQGLAKTNLPGTIVAVTLETGKTLGKFFKGEIDGVECLTELGEKGTGMVSSALFATIGQIVIPIPVVGGLIGGMLGYALSSACYGHLVQALQEAKLAKEERIRIEQECEEAIRMIRAYRAEMEAAISEYLADHKATFDAAFDEIKTALNLGDIDGFIAGANKITKKLGGKPQFENFSEFDKFMKGSESFVL